MYHALVTGGTKIFSLQVTPVDQQNRSFYAYGDHCPPSRHRPATATRKVAPKNMALNTQYPTKAIAVNTQYPPKAMAVNTQYPTKAMAVNTQYPTPHN